MMQPKVSIGIAVWNGEAFLAQALESLLAQDYENLELIILDNISTDRTAEICGTYAQNDARVKYFLDDSQCDVMEGHKRIAALATGKFFMVACDDDWYAPEYVSTLMSLLAANPAVGLAYSGWGWIYPDGTKKPLTWKRFLKANNSRFHNFAYYLFFRSPIPLVFGIVRTELHRDALKYYYRPDHRGWNHDNLYILRLLSMARVDSTEDVFFYYRERDRVALYKGRGQYCKRDGAFVGYLNHVRHQLSVTRAVGKIIATSAFTTNEKRILRAYNLLVLFFFCVLRYLPLAMVYRWLRRPSIVASAKVGA